MKECSPITFWLLLAATIAIDAVVFSQIGEDAPAALAPMLVYFVVAFDALLVGQLCVVCIWATLGTQRVVWLPILIAPFVPTYFRTMLSGLGNHFSDSYWIYFPLYGLATAALVMALWILRGTSFWRRRTGVAHTYQYSLAHLLVVMTVVAILAATMRANPTFGDAKWLNGAFTGCIVLLAVCAVLIWSQPWHWLRRLAATLGVALLLGTAIWLLASFGPPSLLVFSAYFLIQATVLNAWLGLTPILPALVGGSHVENPSQS